MRRARYFSPQQKGLCNFLSRSFVTFRYFCAPARRTTMARRDTVKTHTSAQNALLSTGTAVSTFFCAPGRAQTHVPTLWAPSPGKPRVHVWPSEARKHHFYILKFVLAEPSLRNQIFGRPVAPRRWIVAKSCNFASGVLASGPIFADRRDRRKINHRACRQKLGLIWECLKQKHCF